jgi:SAM-dependent MidA family methyltransferase
MSEVNFEHLKEAAARIGIDVHEDTSQYSFWVEVLHKIDDVDQRLAAIEHSPNLYRPIG